MRENTARRGFSLIELLIVIIIIGVLSAISVSLLSGSVRRAKRSEAIATLGAIRAAERQYYSENNSYTNASGSGGFFPMNRYLSRESANGRYYRPECYSATISSPIAYNISCNSQRFRPLGCFGIRCEDYTNITMNESGFITTNEF